MDLAGLAAVLALPAGLLAAGGSFLNGITLYRRWGRIEKVLSSHQLDRSRLVMVKNARDHLAERLAARELTPRHNEMLGLGTLLILGGVVFIWLHNFPPGWWHGGDWIGSFGFCSFGVGLFLLLVRWIVRTSWVHNHREDSYQRYEIDI